MKKILIFSIILFASTIALGQQKKTPPVERPQNIKTFFISIGKVESKKDYFKRMAATNRKSLVDKKYYAINKYQK